MSNFKSSAIALISLVLVIGIASCKKSSNSTVNPTKFSEIKLNQNFDWSTGQNVTLQVTGIGVLSNEKNFLVVSDPATNAVYSKVYVSMSTNISQTIRVPRGTTSLLVQFGTISKTVKINAGNASFNYTQDLTD